MTETTKPAGRRSGFKLVLASTVVAIAASVGVTAWAQGQPGGYGMGGPGMGGFGMGGPGMGGHGMGGHGMGGPGMMGGNPEFIGRMADHMLDGLNATDAQRTQIRQIAQGAAADLRAQREAGRALRDKGRQLFSAPTIDTAAAEALRQQMLAQHDQGSKRMLQAMLDIGKVLTPEQRAKLGERWKQRSDAMQERAQRLQRAPAPAPKN